MKNECKCCDYICENKQKGIICLNPKSDNFNQKVDLKDSCEHIEFNYYSHPKDDEPGLFDEKSMPTMQINLYVCRKTF